MIMIMITESWGNLQQVGYKFAHFAWKVSLHYLVKFRTIIVISLLQKYKKMFNEEVFFFFSYACHEPKLVSHKTASSSAECSRDKPPFSWRSKGVKQKWKVTDLLSVFFTTFSFCVIFIIEVYTVLIYSFLREKVGGSEKSRLLDGSEKNRLLNGV